MRLLFNLVLLGLVLGGVSFASLNGQMVTLNYYLDSIEIQLSLLLVLVLGAGILIGILASLSSWLRLKRECYKLQLRLKGVKQEVEKLRTLSLEDTFENGS